MPQGSRTDTCTAGAGSLLVEFGVLSRLIGDPVYELSARRANGVLWKLRNAETGLLGKWVVVVCLDHGLLKTTSMPVEVFAIVFYFIVLWVHDIFFFFLQNQIIFLFPSLLSIHSSPSGSFTFCHSFPRPEMYITSWHDVEYHTERRNQLNIDQKLLRINWQAEVRQMNQSAASWCLKSLSTCPDF